MTIINSRHSAGMQLFDCLKVVRPADVKKAVNNRDWYFDRVERGARVLTLGRDTENYLLVVGVGLNGKNVIDWLNFWHRESVAVDQRSRPNA